MKALVPFAIELGSINYPHETLKTTLGLTQLNSQTLEAYLDDLRQWRQALSAKSEILIYGCLVAFESIFHTFLHQLARITGADIGAFVRFPESIFSEKACDRYSLIVAWQA